MGDTNRGSGTRVLTFTADKKRGVQKSNVMKELLTSLISGQPSALSGYSEGVNKYITAQYAPNQFEIMFSFERDKLTDISIVDELGGNCVLFGDSIATPRVKIIELKTALNEDVINYKNQIN